jgi:hypothetical protein
MTRLRCTTGLGLATGQVQLGDFVGSIFKKTNKLLEVQANFDLLDNIKFYLHRRYPDVIDFAVCEVFGLKYRKAFEEYAYHDGVKLNECVWFTNSDKHRIDRELCRIVPEGVKIALKVKDYDAILNLWRAQMGTQWEYAGVPTSTTGLGLLATVKVPPKVEVTVGPSGRRRVYIK